MFLATTLDRRDAPCTWPRRAVNRIIDLYHAATPTVVSLCEIVLTIQGEPRTRARRVIQRMTIIDMVNQIIPTLTHSLTNNPYPIPN